jgi:hypothetical protein
MASPSMTLNLTALANQASIALSGTADTGTTPIDLRTKLEGQFQVYVTFGTVAAVSGLKVEALRAVDVATSSATFDANVAALTYFISSTTSTSKVGSFTLPTGLWKILVTNTDATNAITNVKILYATVDGIA